MTEKQFIYNMFDVAGDFEENKLKLYEIDNNPSDDLDESNLFYMYSSSESNIKSIVDKLNSLVNENEQLKMQLQNISAQRDEFYRGARENANRVGKLKKENKELKEEHERVIDLLNKKLHENDDNDEYTRRVKINLIMELKKELGR